MGSKHLGGPLVADCSDAALLGRQCERVGIV